MQSKLGYKMFFMFAAINIGGMAVFSLCVFHIPCLSVCLLIASV